jgi:hypothetical protein
VEAIWARQKSAMRVRCDALPGVMVLEDAISGHYVGSARREHMERWYWKAFLSAFIAIPLPNRNLGRRLILSMQNHAFQSESVAVIAIYNKLL